VAFFSKLFQEQLGGTNVWALAVDPNGIPRLIPQEEPYQTAPVNYIVLADIAANQNWQVYVIPGPYLLATETSLAPTGPVTMTAPGNNDSYALQIKNGILQVMNVATGVADPVVGELYNEDMCGEQGWLPEYTQPGGIGTPTYPAQSTGSPSIIDGVPQEQGTGMFTAGCGHWFNSFDVITGTYQGGTAAFVRCPLCGYLQEIINPSSLLYTAPFEFVQG
jgi:hypothetical protein